MDICKQKNGKTDDKLFLAMDLGGTQIKYGVYNGIFEKKSEGVVPSEVKPEAFRDSILNIVKSVRNTTDISGVALSLAGFINPKTGENSDFSCSERFTLFNFKDLIESETGLPVSAENDSNCAALCEAKLGAGKGCDDFCVFTIGTGIGGAFIHNGELFRGKHFKAGEFGLCVNMTVENKIRTYKEAEATKGLCKSFESITGFPVDGVKALSIAKSNKALAASYENWIGNLAAIIGNVAVAFDPEKILIGGGISQNATFITDISSSVYSIFPHLKPYTSIEACQFGNEAGKLGALIRLISELNK